MSNYHLELVPKSNLTPFFYFPFEMALTVLVPELLVPGAVEGLRLPALEKLLARADATRVAARGAPAWLAGAWGVHAPLPVAAITLAADDAPRDGHWLRVDPVHLQVEGDELVLRDTCVLDISADEAAALVASLRQLFRDDGLEFIAPRPNRWYVRVPPGEIPVTTSLHDALDRNIFGLLPKGAGKLNWRSAITEVQMLFSGHAVNLKRDAEHRPAVNSVWFWGEGDRPCVAAAPFATVFADDALAIGLARLSGVRAQPLADAFAPRGKSDGNGEALVVLDHLVAPLRRGNLDAWRAAAQSLDEQWFTPLAAALSSLGCVRIVLPGARDTAIFALGGKSRWRFLRSRKPIASHA